MKFSKFLMCAILCLMTMSTECARKTPTDLHALGQSVLEAIEHAAPALYVMERVKKLSRSDMEKKVGLGTLVKFHNTP
ncbi:hypothetical protein K1T71_013663 [Dendrolimus kikuchii]|uniref:Uncharacterized protein n=1 Tax=Dendrolimus kikuchii TaxID=765133 RepID=A0ACC1CH51_9NEOP|nr:hypothetical protein K1T71_013663 [Dendrolimus kikuchii]